MISPKISNTDLTNTFDYWRARTNEMAHALSNYVLTTDANSAYAVTPGNAAISGNFTCNNIFTSGTLTVNTIAIGNSSGLSSYAFVVGNSAQYVALTTNNITIANTLNSLVVTLPTVAETANGQYYLNANGTWTVIDIPAIVRVVANTTGTGTQLIDQFDATQFNAADYLIHVVDNNANNVVTTKLLVSAVGTAAKITDYGGIWSNNNLGYFSVISNSSDITLYFTPTSTNTTVTLIRSAV